MQHDQFRRNFILACHAHLRARLPVDRFDTLMSDHLDLVDGSKNPVPLSGVYEGLLFAAQNAQGKQNQIGRAIGGLSRLGLVTERFDPHWVLKNYQGSDDVFRAVIEVLNPRGSINHEDRGVWPKFSRTIWTGAKFLAQFQDGKDFYAWANRMYEDVRSQDALPMLIERHVYGIRYTLACDFLKEKGFINYGKPDVHVMDILKHVGLCRDNASFYDCQDELRAIALATRQSVYAIDKLIWLVGSGNFYMSENPPPVIPHSKRQFCQLWDNLSVSAA